MKYNKFLSLLVSCGLVFAMTACSTGNRFNLTVDNEAALSDGSELTEDDAVNISIDDVEIPLAIVNGASQAGKVNLTAAQVTKLRANLKKEVDNSRKKYKVKGTTTLAAYTKLNTTSSIRSSELRKKWSHTRPNGKAWSTVLAANGISNKQLAAGEDLAKITFSAGSNYSDNFINQVSQAIHTGLMNSPTHKKVILGTAYKRIGVGVTTVLNNGKITVYVAEHFKN